METMSLFLIGVRLRTNYFTRARLLRSNWVVVIVFSLKKYGLVLHVTFCSFSKSTMFLEYQVTESFVICI